MTLWKNAARYGLVKAVDPFRGGSVAPQSCLRGCLRSSNRPAWSAYAPPHSSTEHLSRYSARRFV